MKILVNGCAGRMGLTLVRLIDADPALELHGGLEGPRHADMGADLGVLAGLPENGKPVRADALELISGFFDAGRNARNGGPVRAGSHCPYYRYHRL